MRKGDLEISVDKAPPRAPSGPSNYKSLWELTQTKLANVPDRETVLVPVEQLAPYEDQPREDFDPEALRELASSLVQHGQLCAILVRPHPQQAGKYQIIAGERRWRAAQMAGLPKVRCTVRALPDEAILELALVENLLREDLHPLEEARTLSRLMDEFGYTQSALAERLGKKRSYVDHKVRLLALPADILARLREAGEPRGDFRFSPGHAKAVGQLDDPALRSRLMAACVEQELSVREAERRVHQLQEAIARVPAGEVREKLLTAILAGLSDAELRFRLSAITRGGRRPEQVAAAEVPDFALSKLATFQVIRERVAEGATSESIARLLEALDRDRRQLKRLLARAQRAIDPPPVAS